MFCENLYAFTLGMQMIFANHYTKITVTKVGVGKIQICYQNIDEKKIKSPIHNRLIFLCTSDFSSLLQAKHERMIQIMRKK